MARPPAPTIEEYRTKPAAATRISGGSRPRPSDGKRPRLTVVTVVRNLAHTIEATIQSVLKYGGDSLEYIVIDGASTDGTVDIIRRYDAQITTWISEPDQGIADGYNKGVALATGDIIHILNGDDCFAPDGVMPSLAALDAHPEVGFSYGHSAFYSGDRLARTFRADPDYARTLPRRMSLSHPSTFVRRAVYERYGLFRLKYRISGDYDFLLRIHLAGVRGILVPQIIANLQLGGVSTTQILRTYREFFRVSVDSGQPLLPAIGEHTVLVGGYWLKRGLTRVKADGVIRTLERWRWGGTV